MAERHVAKTDNRSKWVRKKKKSDKGPSDGIMRVFVSHRLDERQMAERVAGLLFGESDQYEPWYSSEISFSTNWYNEIIKALGECGMFLLLFTDPSESWDWSLYESGLFQGLEEQAKGGLVYLYTAGSEPPSPLAHIQGVEATVKEVAKFLRQLYGSKDFLPKAPHLGFADDEEKVMKVAKDVCRAYVPAPSDRTCNKRIYFEVPRGVDTKDGIPSNTVVRGESTSLLVFDKKPKGPGNKAWTWYDLAHDLPNEAYDVITAGLGAAIALWAKDNNVHPVETTFVAASHDRTEYRPVLDGRRSDADGMTSYEVILVEQRHRYRPEWAILDVLPMTSCILKKIEYYAGQLAACREDDADRKARICEGVLTFQSKIEEHAANIGVRNQAQLRREFSKADQKPLGDLYDNYDKSIGPRLRKAATERDISEVLIALKEWNNASKQFASLAIKRLGEIAQAS